MFNVSIPVKLESAKAFSEENDLGETSLLFESTLGKRILIIDDEASELTLTTELLRKAGISFETAKNPVVALKLIEKYPFDLILTDIQMPKMNGFELIRKLKNSSKTADIPVIALSGRTDVDKKLYLEKGFKGSLTKPYRSNELVQLIAKILDLKTISEEKKVPSNPKNEQKESYDLSEVKTFTQNDEKSLNGILQAFIDSNRENVKRLREFAEKGEISAVSETAHKMLPMFKQLKIESVIPGLEELEQAKLLHLSEAHVRLLVEKTAVQIQNILEEMGKEF